MRYQENERIRPDFVVRILDGTETAALLIWAGNPYISSLGKLLVIRYIIIANSSANSNARRLVWSLIYLSYSAPKYASAYGTS